jgi:hypothetical protein
LAGLEGWIADFTRVRRQGLEPRTR